MQEQQLGTGHAVKCAASVINRPFLLLYGDDIYGATGLQKLVQREWALLARRVEHPERFGVLKLNEDGTVSDMVEKPKEFIGNLINAGLYKFTPEVFDKINEIKKSPRGEYEITDVISLLAKDKKAKIKKIKDYWHDFGNPEDIQKLTKFIKDGYCKKPKLIK